MKINWQQISEDTLKIGQELALLQHLLLFKRTRVLYLPTISENLKQHVNTVLGTPRPLTLTPVCLWWTKTHKHTCIQTNTSEYTKFKNWTDIPINHYVFDYWYLHSTFFLWKTVFYKHSSLLVWNFMIIFWTSL